MTFNQSMKKWPGLISKSQVIKIMHHEYHYCTINMVMSMINIKQAYTIIFIIMNDYTRVQFWQGHEKSTKKISIGPSGYKQYNIVWVLGLYGEYKTFAPRYQPLASPRVDISGLRSYICHIDLEPILYILHIYNIIYIYIYYI